MSEFNSTVIDFTTKHNNKIILSRFKYTSQYDNGSISSKFYMLPIFNWFISINSKLSKCLPDEILFHIFKYIKRSNTLININTNIKFYISTQLNFNTDKWNITSININTTNTSHTYSVFIYNLLILIQQIHLKKTKYILDKYYYISKIIT